MKSAIFVATITENRNDWLEFTAAVYEKIGAFEEDDLVGQLAENVWMVDFQKSPAALSWLVVLCEQRGMQYRILPLADAPQWLPVAFGPKPK